MSELCDRQIIHAWHENATPWINAVRQGEIESRVLVTNQAIMDAILRRTPESVLDIGCGEGWLVRALLGHGIDALGVDVVPALVEAAAKHGPGRYRALAYEALSAATLNETFDAVVCNFSLLGKESVEHVFRQVPLLLNENGVFIVQTLHPVVACGDQPYQDGWRQGSWAGFSEQFREPVPWYFRTRESWQDLYTRCGFKRVDVNEPRHPKTDQPTSLLLVGALA